ncbi:MAG TPA: hypothetical protein VF828_01320 [Patescibacteria group bacterium]
MRANKRKNYKTAGVIATGLVFILGMLIIKGQRGNTVRAESISGRYVRQDGKTQIDVAEGYQSGTLIKGRIIKKTNEAADDFFGFVKVNNNAAYFKADNCKVEINFSAGKLTATEKKGSVCDSQGAAFSGTYIKN